MCKQKNRRRPPEDWNQKCAFECLLLFSIQTFRCLLQTVEIFNFIMGNSLFSSVSGILYCFKPLKIERWYFQKKLFTDQLIENYVVTHQKSSVITHSDGYFVYFYARSAFYISLPDYCKLLRIDFTSFQICLYLIDFNFISSLKNDLFCLNDRLNNNNKNNNKKNKN